MNYKEITLTNEYTGQYKTAPIGFSWTTLLFGCFPSLFRADWKWAAIQFVLAWITAGLSWLVMPFLYNKLYLKDLLNKGFLPTDEAQCSYIVAKGIVNRSEMDFFISKR